MSGFVTQAEFEAAQKIVYRHINPTLQHVWPILADEMGCELWVKHENHTPLGAFKMRGGLVYMHARAQAGLGNGVITASTGNHGQSIPYAAAQHDIPSVVVVPRNNPRDKNNAIRALGAELVEVGHDFDESKLTAEQLAQSRDLHMVPSFHRTLVQGVSTYAHELFSEAGELDAVYVPIGLGSGICGVMAARDLLGLKTKVIGVVSEQANAYRLSVQAGKPVAINAANSFAEGIAVRAPHPEALAAIMAGAERVIEGSEDMIAEAIRALFRATHNVAEGAGAAALAGLMSEKAKMANKRIGVILCGGNIDADKFADVLRGNTPVPG